MTTNKPKQPTHIVWQVFGEKEKSHWSRVGAGWPNRDGKGIHIILDAIPLKGRIMVRDANDFGDTDSAPADSADGGQS